MTPIDPESVDPIIDPASGPTPEGAADHAPAAAAVPAEDEPIEEVLWRFAEENGWLDKPRPPLPPRPPEPKSIHQMTPEEMHESIPLHLRRQRPDGTYYAMGLISRMQQDLEDLTQGKRAATYPEVDEYLGYALLAEGLAPRWLSAPDAVKWWRNGGSAILEESSDAGPVFPDELQKSGLSPELARTDFPGSPIQSQFHNALFSAGQSPLDGVVAGEQTEALGFAPAVFQRSLPGFLSSGVDDEDDASLIQVGLQGGRLGRVRSGLGWRADKPLYSHCRRSSICAQTLMITPPGRWRCLAPRQLTRYNPPPSCRRSIKSGSATRSLSRSVGVPSTTLLNMLSKVISSERPPGSRRYGHAIGEFPEIRTIKQFRSLLYEAIRAPTYVRRLSMDGMHSGMIELQH